MVVSVLFPSAPLPDFALLEQGQVATEDVIADISFDVPKSPERLQLERSEAERGISPIFTYDDQAVTRMLAEGLSSRELRVGPLPPGRYSVRAATADGRSGSRTVNLRAGASRTIEVRVE